MPTAVPAATARLEARISKASSDGTLLRGEVQDAAMRAVEQAEVVRLSLADQQAFADALLAPPKPNAALKKAFTRRKKLLQVD